MASDMEEKICNEIARRQGTIFELNNLIECVSKTRKDEVLFKMETSRLGSVCDLWPEYRDRHNIPVSKYTMVIILKEAVRKEKERINKLVDMLVNAELENRKHEK